MDNNLNEIKKVTEAITPYLKEQNLELFSVSLFTENKNLILQILIEDKSKVIDLDLLVIFSEKINNILDNLKDLTLENYSVEVSTPGIERPLRNFKEFFDAVGKYIYIEFKEIVDEQDAIAGVLIFTDEVTMDFAIEYFIKGRKTKLSNNYKNIKFARLAVKF